MGKTSNDEEYEAGVRDGQRGGVIDDIIQSLNFLDSGSIHDKGYHEGADHRYNDKGERYHSYDGSGSNDSGSSSSGSGSICYLTTACVKAMNLPDNCLELSVLRKFRDKILIPISKGRKAVKEYYRIAPEIVQAVNEQENSQNIWQNTYRNIRHAVSLVLSGDFEGAFRHYQKISLGLKEKFLD